MKKVFRYSLVSGLIFSSLTYAAELAQEKVLPLLQLEDQDAWLQECRSGLSDESKLKPLLEKNNFFEIVDYVRCEKDEGKRLEWLMQKVQEGHDCLMWELSREYRQYNVEQSFFWYELARLRARQDLLCCPNPLAVKFIQCLEEGYILFWSSLKPEWWPSPEWKDITFAKKMTNERLIFLRKVGLQVLERLRGWEKYASPAWINFPCISPVPLVPESEWHVLRKNVTDEYEHYLVDCLGDFLVKNLSNEIVVKS